MVRGVSVRIVVDANDFASAWLSRGLSRRLHAVMQEYAIEIHQGLPRGTNSQHKLR